MYICTDMAKRYATVAELRTHLAAALDHAERGDTVEIELLNTGRAA